jgi:hypothetical protein
MRAPTIGRLLDRLDSPLVGEELLDHHLGIGSVCVVG